MPTNIYGPNDNYDSQNSHFLPALIKKIHNAKIKNKKSITLWGNGKSRRELLYVEDLADSVIFFMNKKTKHSLINIGSGKDMSIKDYALKLMKILNYKTKIKLDQSKPNGTYKKTLNVSLASSYGWKYKINLNEGLKKTYEDFLVKFIT